MIQIPEMNGQRIILTFLLMLFFPCGLRFAVLSVSAPNTGVKRATDGSLLGTSHRTCLQGGPCVPSDEIFPESLELNVASVGLTMVRYVQIQSFKDCSKKFLRLSASDPDLLKIIATQTVDDGELGCVLRIALVPLTVGSLKTSLVVVTKSGELLIQVTGLVTTNPFRIFPFFHNRVPHRTHFKFNVTLFNPLDEIISIQRMYVSGGPFELCLPETYGLPADQRLIPHKTDSWELQPFQPKTVGIVIVDTSRAFREKGYLRIIVNNTVAPEMLISIEMNIYEGSGLFIRESSLDFGILRVDNPCATVTLNGRLLPNSTEVFLDKIIDEQPNKGIRVEMLDLSIKYMHKYTTIANITFCASEAVVRSVQGVIAVKTFYETFRIPYRALILNGSLVPAQDSLLWRIPNKDEGTAVYRVYMQNNLNLPISILKASVEQNDAFSYIEMSERYYFLVFYSHEFFMIVSGDLYPVVIGQSDEAHVASFRVFIKSRISHSVKLKLMTSLDVFEFTIQLYTGELRIELAEVDNWIREGIVFGEDEQAAMFLHNFNIVAVPVHEISMTSKCLRIADFSLCDIPSNCSTTFRRMPESVMLSTGSSLKILLEVKEAQVTGQCTGFLNITTGLQKLSMPATVNVLPGRIRLYESPVIVDNIFPTSFIQRNLTVLNTFPTEIEMLNIFSEEFPGLKMYPSLNGIGISSQMGLSFDTLTFDGRTLCRDLPGLCYVGFDLDTKSEKSEAWKRPFRIINFSSVEIDRRMREKQYEMWKLISGPQDALTVETSLTVTTKEKYTFYLPVTLRFVWPDPVILMQSEKIEFPLLTIGNSTEIEIGLANPSSRSLYIHAYVFKDDKSRSWNGDIFCVKSILPMSGKEFYSVDDERLPARSRLPTPVKGSLAAIIPPETQFKMRLKFQPQAQSCYDAVLYVRNNLTVVETVHVYGCGTEPKLRISPLRADPNGSSLVMKFTEKDAALCRNQTANAASRKLIRRSGEISILNFGGSYVFVEKISINELDWYGPSFKVVDLKPFLLVPKEKKTLSIIYNPDFGARSKKAVLNIVIKHRRDPFTLDLVGSIDEKAIAICAPIFGRGDNDFWITTRNHWQKWGWTIKYLPVLLLALYIAFARDWFLVHARKIAKMRLVAQVVENNLSASPSNKKYSSKSSSVMHKLTATNSDEQLTHPDVLTFAISQLDEPKTVSISMFKKMIEPSLPEESRELISVLLFHSSLITYFHHISFPKSYLIRFFIFVELLIMPINFVIFCLSTGVPIIISCVRLVCHGVRKTLNYQRAKKSMETEKETVITGVKKNEEIRKSQSKSVDDQALTHRKPSCDSSSDLKTNDTENFYGQEFSTPVVEPEVVRKPNCDFNDSPVEKSPKVFVDKPKPAESTPEVIAPKKPTQPVPHNSVSNHQSSQPPVKQLEAIAPKPARNSRRERRAAQLQSDQLETDRDSSSISNRSQSAENQRQAKDPIKVIPKPRIGRKNNIGDKSPEAQVKTLTEKPKNPIESSKAKVPVRAAPSIPGSIINSPKPVAAASVKPVDATSQAKAIQDTFFKVIYQDKGFLFLDLDVEECVQLVKQMKFNHVFHDNPKVVIENLARSVKHLPYRLNGVEIDLAIKSSVLACTSMKPRPTVLPNIKKENKENGVINYEKPKTGPPPRAAVQLQMPRNVSNVAGSSDNTNKSEQPAVSCNLSTSSSPPFSSPVIATLTRRTASVWPVTTSPPPSEMGNEIPVLNNSVQKASAAWESTFERLSFNISPAMTAISTNEPWDNGRYDHIANGLRPGNGSKSPTLQCAAGDFFTCDIWKNPLVPVEQTTSVTEVTSAWPEKLIDCNRDTWADFSWKTIPEWSPNLNANLTTTSQSSSPPSWSQSLWVSSVDAKQSDEQAPVFSTGSNEVTEEVGLGAIGDRSQ